MGEAGSGAVGSAAARELLARMLRQREEMGQPPVFLDDLRRSDALQWMEAVAGVGLDVEGRAAAKARVRASLSEAPLLSPSPRAPRTADRSGPSFPAPSVASIPLPVLPADHEGLRGLVAGCVRCGLSQGRTQVVFNDGVLGARLMVVGEAPGKNEDETGLPFVGAAGKLLDLLLMSVDLSRKESVYICNVLKCRPPGNRNPLPEEIEACRPFLERQIEIVAPRLILAVGTFAAQWLTRSEAPLGKLRGQVYSYQGVPLVVTYHPAALLRNPGWTAATWDDLQLVRQILDPQHAR